MKLSSAPLGALLALGVFLVAYGVSGDTLWQAVIGALMVGAYAGWSNQR